MNDYELVNPEKLNNEVWATIAPSKIHGVGVHAIRDIGKGQKLYFFGGDGKWIRTELKQLNPKVSKLIKQRWPIERDGHPYYHPNDDAFLVCFLNHSDNPNYDKLTDTALRDIKEGAEITEDYGVYKDII